MLVTLLYGIHMLLLLKQGTRTYLIKITYDTDTSRYIDTYSQFNSNVDISDKIYKMGKQTRNLHICFCDDCEPQNC